MAAHTRITNGSHYLSELCLDLLELLAWADPADAKLADLTQSTQVCKNVVWKALQRLCFEGLVQHSSSHGCYHLPPGHWLKYGWPDARGQRYYIGQPFPGQPRRYVQGWRHLVKEEEDP